MIASLKIMLKYVHANYPRYCWIHQELGYVQGMCDILAPLLVLMDDGELCTAITYSAIIAQVFHCLSANLYYFVAEVLVYQCYLKVMDRMECNFPPNLGVSDKLSNLRALVEVRHSNKLKDYYSSSYITQQTVN